MTGLIIIGGVLLLLAILAVGQRKEGEADDKKMGRNLEGFLNVIDELRNEE